MRPRLQSLLKNLALSAASLFIFVALLESILRLMGYGHLEIYQPDPVLYWRLKPNQNCYTKIGHKPVRINAHGTRGPDFASHKPPGTLRILSLGDSKTFGWGLTEKEAYSGRLEDLLQQWAGPRRKVEVINAGVNAWSYPQIKNYFRNEGVAYQPDAVILADANFWTQFGDQNSPEFVRKFMNRVRLKNFLRRFALYHYFIEVKLNRFYQAHRSRFIPVDPAKDTLFKAQQREPEVLVYQAIQGLCQSARDHSIKPVLVFIPFVDARDPPFQEKVLASKQAISRELGIPLIDLSSETARAGKSLYLPDDAAHLNVTGNEIVARLLFQSLTNLLSNE